jgi:hypothetical protein
MTEEITHRGLCRVVARWLLDQRWTHLVGWEVGCPAGQLDAVGISAPFTEFSHMAEVDEASTEDAQFKLLAEQGAEWRARGRGNRLRGLRPPPLARRLVGSRPRARVVAVEVKKTRSDLLQDLKKRKMLNYERVATECYLAATAEAFGGNVADLIDHPESLKLELAGKGLPDEWGIMLLVPDRFPGVVVLRRPKSLREFDDRHLLMWEGRISRSTMYRALSYDSPMSEEKREGAD